MFQCCKLREAVCERYWVATNSAALLLQTTLSRPSFSWTRLQKAQFIIII